MGATQFRLLTSLGLREEHYVLDLGCGSLRAGRLLLPYLLPGHYHGIEPAKWLLDQVIEAELGADFIARRGAVFSHNEDFDCSVFGRRFDFILAQSVFSHTGPDLMEKGFRSIRGALAPVGLALLNFAETEPGQTDNDKPGWFYNGSRRYHHATVLKRLADSGLAAQVIPWFHPRLVWVVAALSRDKLLSTLEIAALGTGAILRDPRF